MAISEDRALEIAMTALAARAERIAEERGYRKTLVLQMWAKGARVADIAEHTGLKRTTVQDYITRRDREQ